MLTIVESVTEMKQSNRLLAVARVSPFHLLSVAMLTSELSSCASFA